MREAWRRPHCAPRTALEPGQAIQYRASGDWHDGFGEGWRPSIHMPRWASRLTLEITSIRVERVQDISAADAMAEGVQPDLIAGQDIDIDGNLWASGAAKYREAFLHLFYGINKRAEPDANPWVWVVSFKRIAPSPASTPQPRAEVSTRSEASPSSRSEHSS